MHHKKRLNNRTRYIVVKLKIINNRGRIRTVSVNRFELNKLLKDARLAMEVKENER